jgi:hypothetical protein
MKYAAAIFLAVHGFAHLVGFVGAFGLSKDVPHSTTILGGRADLGEQGIRTMGSLWAVVALAFAATAIGILLRANWTLPVLLCTTLASLALCAVTLPDAKIGLVLDILILAALMTASRLSILKEFSR